MATNENEKYYKGTDRVHRTNKTGWSQLLIKDTIPTGFSASQLNVYVYTNGESNTYFDDLEIRKIGAGDSTVANDFQPPSIGLLLNDKQFEKIKKSRLTALEKGIIITTEDSWAKGKLLDGGRKKDADVRLKGDWLDHFCLLYTSPSPRDQRGSRMPSSA